jgi:hypothetical protein
MNKNLSNIYKFIEIWDGGDQRQTIKLLHLNSTPMNAELSYEILLYNIN